MMVDNELENLSDDELDRVKKMLDIAKLNYDIAKIQQEINQNHEINMATIAKMKAETEKISKETKFYPMLTISMGVAVVIGGMISAIISKML